MGKVGGVAIEVWTMDNNYYFSNILVDQDPSVAEKVRSQYWQPKQALEVSVFRHQACMRAGQLGLCDSQWLNGLFGLAKDGGELRSY